MSSGSPARLFGLEAARGVAAVLVALAHANMWSSFKPFGGLFGTGVAGVDFFFVLSGFLMPYVYGTRLGQRDALGRYAWRRFARVFPPYWVVTLLTLPAVLAWPAFRPDIEWSTVYAIANFLLLPSAGYPIVAPAWTLQNEAFFYLLFGIGFFSRRALVAALGLWLALIVAGLVVDIPMPLSLVAKPVNLGFFFGIAVAVTGLRGGPRMLAAGAAMFLATMIAQVAAVPLWGAAADTQLGRVLIYGAASSLIVAALREMPIRSQVARWLGDLSYPLYLVHFPVMATLMVHGWSPGGWWFLVGYVSVAVLCAGAFRVLVEAPMLAWLRRAWSLRSVRPAAARTAEDD